MATLLVDELIGSVIKVEVTREPGDSVATLTVKNDVKIDRELRTRPHFTKMKTTDIPDSANALFKIMVESLLVKPGFPGTDLRLVNLPKFPVDATDFSASVTFHVMKQSDDSLREVFTTALDDALKQMADSRFVRRVGNWSDAKGARGNTLGGL